MQVINPRPYGLKDFELSVFGDIFFSKTLPIQLSGLSQSMPAYKKWSFDFFREKAKGIPCQISDDLTQPAHITRKIPIDEYISLIEKGQDCPYMTGWSYQRHLPQLDNDIYFPECHPEDFIEQLPRHMQFRRRWIFLGKKGISCDLHIDCFSTSAWLLMIKGQKTMRAISPLHRHHIEMSASLFDDKIVAYLAKHGVKVLEFTLTPRTLFYIPTGWVHQIRNDTNTIMVTGGFTAKQHTIRFYKNYHSYIAKDSLESDLVFNRYIKTLESSELVLSDEVKDSIEEDIAYTQKRLDLITERQELYKLILRRNSLAS